MLTKRSVASVVILNIITCGIYGFWWTYVTLTALQAEGKITSLPPIATVLLLIFVSSAGGALLGYDADANINEIKKERGLNTTDNKILWIVLGVLIPVVTMALVQNEINGLA